MSRTRRLLISLVLLLFSSPAFAYIVFLKNGQQITVKDKPRIVGNKAIVVMPSGTESSIEASEIDFAKTEEVNKTNFGTAKLIEGRDSRLLEQGTKVDKSSKTVGELIAERRVGLSLPEPPTPPSKAQGGGDLPRTAAGYVDLFTLALERKAYRQTDITTELLQYLRGQGLEGVSIYEGSKTKRALLEIATNSEAAVFKGLKESANALIQARGSFPGQLEALELVMVTDARVRAGQFVLTPELATLLASGEIEPTAFFLRYVEF